MDIHNAPTFITLNKPQKRALILRDQLRYLDTRHLDTFIEGLTTSEPPTYTRHNGAIHPSLTEVTLKDAAIRFDLGNVHFDNDISLGTGIYRAYLTVEDGRFELRTEEGLMEDEADLNTVPIHAFIAKNMVPMFEVKFRAIWARKNQVNEMRRVAYEMAGQVEDEFEEGVTLASLDSERHAQIDATSEGEFHEISSSLVANPASAIKSRKRRPGEPITKHSSNKRTRVGLDTIPDEAKTATFNSIPNQVKVDLFNNVMKTAFPNFDNLMVASWNVVSVYSNVGSDFPELHKSIVELKSVLQDFEESVGARVTRSEPEFRRDFAPEEELEDANDHRSARPAPDATQDGTSEPATALLGGVNSTSQQRDHVDVTFNEIKAEDNTRPNRYRVRSPRKRQKIQSQQTTEVDDHQDTPEEPRPERRRNIPTPSSRSPSNSPPFHKPSLEAASTRSSPNPYLPIKDPHNSSLTLPSVASHEQLASAAPHHTPLDNTTNPPSSPPAPKSLDTTPLPDLRALYKKRKHELLSTFGGSHNVPQQYRVQMQELAAAIKTRERKESTSNELGSRDGDGDKKVGLGKSVLGGKKGGMAPVAKMLGLKRDGGAKKG